MTVEEEIKMLKEENEALKKAYKIMRNAAAGLTNYCEPSASTRRCEREYEEAQMIYREFSD